MSRYRVKNLIILILLVCCGFLLCLVIPARLEERNHEAQTLRQLRELFARADVVLEPETLPETGKLYAGTLPDAALQQEQAAKLLLGDDCTPAAVPGGIRYDGDGGSCVTENGGGITCKRKSTGAPWESASEAEALLEKLDVSHSELRYSGKKPVTITAPLTLNGCPIFGEALKLFYEDDRLTAISGTLLPRAPVTRTEAPACCSALDALTAFWSSRLEIGWVGGRILSVTQGYLLENNGGSINLRPAWLISTDSSEFSVDGITKIVNSIS